MLLKRKSSEDTVVGGMLIMRAISQILPDLWEKSVRDPYATSKRLAFMAGVYTRRVRTKGRILHSFMLKRIGKCRRLVIIRRRPLVA